MGLEVRPTSRSLARVAVGRTACDRMALPTDCPSDRGTEHHAGRSPAVRPGCEGRGHRELEAWSYCSAAPLGKGLAVAFARGDLAEWSALLLAAAERPGRVAEGHDHQHVELVWQAEEAGHLVQPAEAGPVGADA